MKKTLTAIALMLGFTATAMAQDCSYKKNEVDDFTGKVNIMMNPQVVGKSTNSNLKLKYSHIRMGDTQAGFWMLSYDLDVGCASYSSYIQIKWDDDTVTEFKNQGDADCGDSPVMMTAYFDSKMNSTIQDLTDKIPVMIRMQYTEGYITFNVTDPEVFRNQTRCCDR